MRKLICELKASAEQKPEKALTEEKSIRGNDLLGRAASLEQMQRAVGVESAKLESLDSLRRAAGVETSRADHDPVKHLEQSVGLARGLEEQPPGQKIQPPEKETLKLETVSTEKSVATLPTPDTEKVGKKSEVKQEKLGHANNHGYGFGY